jgi:WD40 repeat protein
MSSDHTAVSPRRFVGPAEDGPASVVVLPDGASIVIGFAGGAVRRVELSSGATLWEGERTHGKVLQALVHSPDGTTIASCAEDRLAMLWDADTGRAVGELPHPGGVFAIAFSPDGSHLATGASDDDVRIWRLDDMTSVMRLSGHAAWVTSVAWVGDGTTLLSGSNDATVRYWDPSSGEPLRCLELAGRPLALERQQDRLALASSDTYAYVLEASTFEPLYRMAGHTGEVNCAAWSPDGSYVATGSDDRSVRIWGTEPIEGLAREVARFDVEAPFVWRLAWSPDASFLAAGLGDNSVVIIDTTAIGTGAERASDGATGPKVE